MPCSRLIFHDFSGKVLQGLQLPPTPRPNPRSEILLHTPPASGPPSAFKHEGGFLRASLLLTWVLQQRRDLDQACLPTIQEIVLDTVVLLLCHGMDM